MSLHGTRSTAARQARLSGFEQLADTASAVGVFPQAIKPIGSGYEWDPGHGASIADASLSAYDALKPDQVPPEFPAMIASPLARHPRISGQWRQLTWRMSVYILKQ